MTRRTLSSAIAIAAVSLSGLLVLPITAAAQGGGIDRDRQGWDWGWDNRNQYTASVRIDVQPRFAEVFIDGSFVGRVDDYDGIFQRLRLRPGYHDLTLYAPGFRVERQRAFFQPNTTRTIRFNMIRVGRGQFVQRPIDRGRGDWYDPRFDQRNDPRYDPRFDQPNRYPQQYPQQGGFGTLSLFVAPIDAEILVDGRRWSHPGGNRRLAVQLAPGRHRVEVRRAGYRPYGEDVVLRQGATFSVNVTLRRN